MFGLLGTEIPIEIVSVLFFFSPVILIFFKKKSTQRFLLGSGMVVILCRVIAVMLDTRGKMLVSGLGVAAFLVFFPALFVSMSHTSSEEKSKKMGVGLLLAVSMSVLFRALKSGFDITMYDEGESVGWALAILAVFLIWKKFPFKVKNTENGTDESSTGRVIGYSLGMTGVLLLLYFAFTSLNVVSRWTGVNYFYVINVVAFSVLLFLVLCYKGKGFSISNWMIFLWNLVFVVSVVLTILPHQLKFPAASEGYPLLEPPISTIQLLPLFIMLLTFPILIIDFIRFSQGLIHEKPSLRKLGIGFSITSLFMLVMILGNVFTTVYDYIPVVGPAFRDKFWLIHFLIGAILFLPLLFLEKKEKPKQEFSPGYVFLIIFIVFVAASLVNNQVSAKPIDELGEQRDLRILTYNIQQGYSEDGFKNFDGQLDLIKALDPDIIGLQESDTNRIAGGNVDIVRYFADQLDMYSYYGPSVVSGTFGIAMLSKYPIEDAKTYYMYSVGEQTAVIEASVSVGGEIFNVYVTHLGNEGPIIQQEQILEILKGKDPVIVMGDFNFRPESEQYNLTNDILEDSFLISEEEMNIKGFDVSDRIDYVFVSPGILVEEAIYYTGPQSDHPAMFVVVSW